MLTILGNITFLLGSVAFLDETWKSAGVWLFIVGSVCMVIDSSLQRQQTQQLKRQLEQLNLELHLYTTKKS
jgi:FixJ family two-component response regulator